MPQVERGPDDGCLARVVGDAHNEGPVDLHLAHRQPREVRQRGVAASKVVNGQAHPQPPESLQALHGALRVCHHDAFRELESQKAFGTVGSL